jgi:hypothetical protein
MYQLQNLSLNIHGACGQLRHMQRLPFKLYILTHMTPRVKFQFFSWKQEGFPPTVRLLIKRRTSLQKKFDTKKERKKIREITTGLAIVIEGKYFFAL